MTATVLFAAKPSDWATWADPLRAAFAAAGVDADLATDHPADRVDYVVYAPHDGFGGFDRFPRLKAVLSLWAGVERIVGDPTLTVPLARMVDPGLTAGMIEYVAGHVLRHHLDLDRSLAASRAGDWDYAAPPLAADRRVGVLGLGALGAPVATALAALGFDVAGWSRRPKEVPGIEAHAGDGGLATVLARSDILVLLLPATPDTEGLIDAAALARLPAGAVIVNPGRGTLIDDDALLAALDRGHLAHATLDVFRTEPLPADHPFWAHPSVTVTPHVASATRPPTASTVIAENVRRREAGEPLLHLVDRDAGY